MENVFIRKPIQLSNTWVVERDVRFRSHRLPQSMTEATFMILRTTLAGLIFCVYVQGDIVMETFDQQISNESGLPWQMFKIIAEDSNIRCSAR